MGLKRTILNLLLLSTIACSTINILDGRRIFPKHNGVDPFVAPMADEWLNLAKQHGLKFKHNVAIGFENIDRGNAIGVTEYGLGFREIGLDPIYWQYSSTVSRMELMYHELSHAYCNREHDYAKDKPYKEQNVFENRYQHKDGFFSDDCPTSIMYPTTIDDICFLSHYSQYVEEMFDRCEPY